VELAALVAAEPVVLATAVAPFTVVWVAAEAIAPAASAVVFPPAEGGAVGVDGSLFALVSCAFVAWMLTKSESIREEITCMMMNRVS